MKVALAAVALNLALNLSLIWSLREAGLAWATGGSAVAQCVALLWIQARRTPGPRARWIIDRSTGAALARIMLMSVVMGAAAWGALAAFGPDAPATWSVHLARLVAAVLAGGATYGVLAVVFRAPELRWLLARGAARPPAPPAPEVPPNGPTAGPATGSARDTTMPLD
jgi:peptidoglycan biosynthesis protein MviN/MurJ (putative lipid II flippase)